MDWKSGRNERRKVDLKCERNKGDNDENDVRKKWKGFNLKLSLQ
jgi:hypothetical protein